MGARHVHQVPVILRAAAIPDAVVEAAIAADVTRRIRLGTLVAGVTYRRPALLAKTATTLDVLSRGRAFFGIDAAWYEREHLGLGVPYPPIGERFERLEELIAIAGRMRNDDDGAFSGPFTSLAETIWRPAPPRGHRTGPVRDPRLASL